MFPLVLALLPWSCRKDDGPILSTEPTDPGPCVLETTQYAAREATRTRHPSCGEALLDDFRVRGDGSFTLELFTDGQRIIPSLRAEGGDAVFRGLHARGIWVAHGEGPARTWGLGLSASEDPGVSEAEEVSLDADGLPIAGAPGTSWWAGIAGRPGGPAVLVGAHTSWQTAFRVAFGADGALHAVWDTLGEDIPVRQGMLLYLDPLFMAVGPDPAELLEAWAGGVASTIGADVGAPPPTAWRVRAEDESEVVAALASLAADAPVDAMIVEPAGALDLAPLPSLLASEGLIAGVRVAPATVEAVGARVAEGWGLLELDVSGIADASVVAYRAELSALLSAAGGRPAWVVGGQQLPSVGIASAAGVGPALGGVNGSWWWNVPEPIDVDAGLDDPMRGGIVRAAIVGGAWSGVGDPGLAGEALPVDLVEARGAASSVVGALDRAGSPVVWSVGDLTALLNEGAVEVEVEVPGGIEILTGATAEPGVRRLGPGAGELWR